MGLKITTQIGTSKGITSEAYVRISEYQVSKYGSANFKLEVFQCQEDASFANTVPVPVENSPAQSQQIGDSLYVSLVNSEKQIDLFGLEEDGIFIFGYSHLKAKLEGLFGVENIQDC